MRRGLMAFFAALLLLAAAGSVMADGEANFKKAGQQVLAEKERLLAEKRDVVFVLASQVAVDQTVTGSEMRALQKGIEDFNRDKTAANDYLKFYALATSVVLPDELARAVERYWVSIGFFARDKNAMVKTYLVRLTGRDVVVQNHGPVNGPLQLFLMVMAASLTIAPFVMLINRERKSFVIPIVTSSTFAAVSWLTLFFI